jgi:hypothetical protein
MGSGCVVERKDDSGVMAGVARKHPPEECVISHFPPHPHTRAIKCQSYAQI